jgi:phage regulator Rha-like protein
MTDLMVIEQQGVRVLTTAQLAECYGTDTTTIKQNFNNNKRRYEEGKHYVLLKGADLQAFKNQVENFDLVKKNASALYLWTERGALLHAKSLNTDKAWEVYDQLVETYFRAKKAQAALNELSPQLQFMIRMETEQNALKQRVDNVERRLETLTVPTEKPAPKKHTCGKPWSERELDYLRKAYALGQTDTEIATDMGRTVDSIKNKRRVLGLCDDSRGRRRWRPDEDKKLIKYYNQGISAYDIGQLLGRSLEGVENRLHRLRKAGKV